MDEISGKSWIFRIGHFFISKKDRPLHIDDCTLVMRFVFAFVPWLAINLIFWVLVGLVFGILGHLVGRTWWFLASGQKLVYDASEGGIEDIIGGGILDRLLVFNYRRKPVRWLQWIPEENGVRSPFVFFFSISLAIALAAYLIYKLPVLIWGISFAGKWTANLVYTTFGVWGPVVALAVAVPVLFLVISIGHRRFVSSSSGKVLTAYFREWKQQHCRVYRVV